MRPNTRPAIKGSWAEKAMAVIARRLSERIAAYEVFHPGREDRVYHMAIAENQRRYDRMREKGRVQWARLPVAQVRVSVPKDWSEKANVTGVIDLSPADQPSDVRVAFPDTGNRGLCFESDPEDNSTRMRLFLNPHYPLKALRQDADYYLGTGLGVLKDLEAILAHEASHAVDERVGERRTLGYAQQPTEVKAFMSGMAHELARFARAEGLSQLPLSRQAAWIDAHAKYASNWYNAVGNGMSPQNQKIVLKGVWQHLVDEGYFAST